MTLEEVNNLRDFLLELGDLICDQVRIELLNKSVEQRASIHHKSKSDMIYQLDHTVDKIIVSQFTVKAADFGGVVLIAEGIGEDEKMVFPEGISEYEAAYKIIMDPIDGTRGIMYDKRSAFFLAGVAPNKFNQTKLSDIFLSVLIELPTSRQIFSDVVWAKRGEGVNAVRRDLKTGEKTPLEVTQSKDKSIRGGFTQFVRFFTPGKHLIAELEEGVLSQLFPDAKGDEILTFEDQYLSSGGQLYEMLMGRDRLVVDVRSGLNQLYSKRNKQRRVHVCHPYDLCAHLIGEEAGLIIVDKKGKPLDSHLDTNTAVDWIGFANTDIQDEVMKTLLSQLEKHGLQGD